jgi:spore germination cell wall hydrolase CwlJ-like protein
LAPTDFPEPKLRQWGWVIGFALLALLATILIVSQMNRGNVARKRPDVASGPKGFAVPVNLPGIEVVETPKIAPEEAKKLNAAQPFMIQAVVAARPFRLIANNDDTNKAVDCLAAAIHYEAGNETVDGQKAVAQVILNRMRHPAYPKTVCGVVFQGSERTTGCQFTFTCDGAINRTPSEGAWRRAQSIARMMLTGTVYAPVGWATHYHTDWVFPSWSAKLDKVRQEGTHLFFRWREFWGTPAAFRGRYTGNEANQPKLSLRSAFHVAAPREIQLAVPGGLSATSGPTETAAERDLPPPPAGAQRTFINPAGDYQIYLVSQKTDPDALLNLSLQACGDQMYCKIMIWSDRTAVPAALPVTDEALTKLSFSYLRNRSNGFEKALWNCGYFKRSAPGQCIKHQSLPPKTDPASTPIPAATNAALP